MKRVILLMAVLSLCACDPTTLSTSTGVVQKAQTMGGIWRGSMTTASGATVTGIVIVAEDGKFVSESQNTANLCADVAQGQLTATGSGLAGSSDIGIVDYTVSVGVQIDCGFTDGSVSGTATVTGSFAQQATMTLDSVNTSALAIALPDGTATLTYDKIYNETPSLAKLAGNWNLSTGVALGINASGVITAQDPSNGCTLSGQVSIDNAQFNAYSVSVTYTNCDSTTAALNGLTATGLLTEDDTVSPKALYAVYSMTLADGQVLIVPVFATN